MKVQVWFPSAPQTDHDAAIVARIVALIHTHRIGDYLAASAIHLKLEELGVLVRLPKISDTKRGQRE